MTGKYTGINKNLTSLVGIHSPLAPATKLLFYKGLLRPVLTYAIPVWASRLSQIQWGKLQICQNKTIKAAISEPWGYNTVAAHQEAGIQYMHDYVLHLSTKFWSRAAARFPELDEAGGERGIQGCPTIFIKIGPPDMVKMSRRLMKWCSGHAPPPSPPNPLAWHSL